MIVFILENTILQNKMVFFILSFENVIIEAKIIDNEFKSNAF